MLLVLEHRYPFLYYWMQSLKLEQCYNLWKHQVRPAEQSRWQATGNMWTWTDVKEKTLHLCLPVRYIMEDKRGRKCLYIQGSICPGNENLVTRERVQHNFRTSMLHCYLTKIYCSWDIITIALTNSSPLCRCTSQPQHEIHDYGQYYKILYQTASN